MTPQTPSGRRLLEKNTSRDTATNEWLLNDILAIEREAYMLGFGNGRNGNAPPNPSGKGKSAPEPTP